MAVRTEKYWSRGSKGEKFNQYLFKIILPFNSVFVVKLFWPKSLFRFILIYFVLA